MIANILAFLGSLPEILKLINSLMSWLNKVSGNDPQGFIIKTGDAFSSLANAKTEEEHANAAKNLADLIRNLPH